MVKTTHIYIYIYIYIYVYILKPQEIGIYRYIYIIYNSFHILNSMDSYLRPKVSCRFIMTIINDIYIYFLYIYDSSITDIEHSPNYTVFGLPQTHRLR